ncbi:hypothetical protein GCM10025859_23270 [Alicyclobacillus fastidiosus]|nr:hypothetical protein GCM10025859_23270 [Alicyclobacillus fastidiosus]
MNIWSGSQHNPIPNRDLARETLVATPIVIRQMTPEERAWVESLTPPQKRRKSGPYW